MLLRIVGEVLVGLLAAGVVTGIVVPATMRFGYEARPWLAWVSAAAAIAVSIAIGERRHKRRRASQSP
jgi:chromate transport protein ChrA